MTFKIITFGCKVNQYDSGIIRRSMKDAGFLEITENSVPADVYIINSCTVTENADKKAIHEANRLRALYPESLIVLSGCFPQAFPEKAKESSADIITGSGSRSEIPALILSRLGKKEKAISIPALPGGYEENVFSEEEDKTRAFIKIEDGCDRFCSYCAIPYARGRVRSRSLEGIRSEVKAQSQGGHKEIVLSGVNLSCYGKDIGLSLPDAVKAAADNPMVSRVRLSSLEPELLTPEIIKTLAKIEKLCPHFHLSLQSGCQSTLARMNRHYTPAEYGGIVNNIREVFPGCAITTDIMVGFCGETEEEFEASFKFVEKIGFSRLHVFTYSKRSGTAAEKRSDHIPENVKLERYRRMSGLAEKLKSDYLKSQLGLTGTVLIEKRTSPDYVNGHTENYTLVRIYGADIPRHTLVKVKITGVGEDWCIGQLMIENLFS